MGEAAKRGLGGRGDCSAMLFAQTGDASYEAVWASAERIEKLLAEKGIPLSRAKQVRHMVIELLENVMHYGKLVKDERCRRYEVEVWHDASTDEIEVLCSNLVRRPDVAEFSAYLKKVCSYTPAEAKQAVREVLLSDFGFLSGGAGIGLLMVRQRSVQINWSFALEDEQYERYTISLRV